MLRFLLTSAAFLSQTVSAQAAPESFAIQCVGAETIADKSGGNPETSFSSHLIVVDEAQNQVSLWDSESNARMDPCAITEVEKCVIRISPEMITVNAYKDGLWDYTIISIDRMSGKIREHYKKVLNDDTLVGLCYKAVMPPAHLTGRRF